MAEDEQQKELAQRDKEMRARMFDSLFAASLG
jgi:hypothetical protein